MWMKAELFWREASPSNEYDRDVDRHNELLPPQL